MDQIFRMASPILESRHYALVIGLVSTSNPAGQHFPAHLATDATISSTHLIPVPIIFLHIIISKYSSYYQ
jgi:hypothetical protein